MIAHARASNTKRRHLPCSAELRLECRGFRNCGNLHLHLTPCLFHLCFLLLFPYPLSFGFSTLVLLHCPLFLRLSVSVLVCSHRLLFPFPPCQPLLHATLARIWFCPIDTISILHLVLAFPLLPLSVPVVHESDRAVLLGYEGVRDRCTLKARGKERSFVHL